MIVCCTAWKGEGEELRKGRKEDICFVGWGGGG